jgi:hypothetical protein
MLSTCLVTRRAGRCRAVVLALHAHNAARAHAGHGGCAAQRQYSPVTRDV